MIHTPRPSAMTSVPQLNFQTFLAGDAAAQQQFAQAVGAALQAVGFFRLTHTGLDPGVVQQAYASAAEFFALPTAVKQRYERGSSGQSGFTRFGREQAKDAALPDLKEFWQLGRACLSQEAAAWPAEVPLFGPAVVRLYQQLETCAIALLEACALALGQPRRWLSQMAVGGSSVLRLAHYPPLAAAPAGSLRAAPHEDINLITLLCEATAPGLEILTRQGEWLPLQAEPGELIIDTGDMMQNLTNGLFRSTTHRVVNGAEQGSRLSLPFFVHPRPEIDLSPHPACIAQSGGQARYPSLTAATYLAQRLREIGLQR